VLAAPSDERAIDTPAALARFHVWRLRREVKTAPRFNRFFATAPRAVWSALTLLIIGITVLSLAPVRSWADKILEWFRIQKIEVVGIPGGPDSQRSIKLIGQLLSDQIVITKSAGEPQPVGTMAEASQIAGFPVRLPSRWNDTPQLMIIG